MTNWQSLGLIQPLDMVSLAHKIFKEPNYLLIFLLILYYANIKIHTKGYENRKNSKHLSSCHSSLTIINLWLLLFTIATTPISFG